MKNQDIADLNINLIDGLLGRLNDLRVKITNNTIFKSDLEAIKSLLKDCTNNLDETLIYATQLE